MSTELDALAGKIADAHAAVHQSTSQAVEHAVAAGRLLVEAKGQVDRGNWVGWITERCGFSVRTAQAYMRLAKQWPNAQHVAHSSLREVLRALSTPKSQADLNATEPVFAHDSIIEAAFTHFRQAGFPYRHVPIHVAMQRINQLAATAQPALMSSTVGYDVADSYHPHRFRATGKGYVSPVDAFGRDNLLRRALSKELEQAKPIPAGYFGGLSIVSGAQPCSNFRPGVALHYYRRYCKTGATVLDTSAGYGGRLVGYLASRPAGRYIGIEPNRETHEGNTRLAADMGYSAAVELHCLPVEDVSIMVVRGRCDFALTSPPYFTKEHYSHEPTQSWIRYPTPDSWREGFLRPMLRLQYEALKPGAISIINVDDVKVGTKTHKVSEWTKAAATEAGFELVGEERLALPAAYWATVHDVDPSEPIFIFKRR